MSGWTIFDKLYLLNGTLYLVSDEPSKIPARSLMISTGIPIENGPIEQAKQVPTDRELQIISRRDAKALFGLDAELIEGVSVSCPSFFRSYTVLTSSLRQWLVNDDRQLYVLSNRFMTFTQALH